MVALAVLVLSGTLLFLKLASPALKQVGTFRQNIAVICLDVIVVFYAHKHRQWIELLGKQPALSVDGASSIWINILNVLVVLSFAFFTLVLLNPIKYVRPKYAKGRFFFHTLIYTLISIRIEFVEDYRLEKTSKRLLVIFLLYNYVVVLYASAYWLILPPAAFWHPLKNFWDAMYFSTITIATVGYGDIAPQSLDAKLLVISEVFLGILLLVFTLSFVMTHVKDDSGNSRLYEKLFGRKYNNNRLREKLFGRK